MSTMWASSSSRRFTKSEILAGEFESSCSDETGASVRCKCSVRAWTSFIR